MAGGYLEWNVWKNALFSMLLAAIIYMPWFNNFFFIQSKQKPERKQEFCE